jgi:hypothetical protein
MMLLPFNLEVNITEPYPGISPHWVSARQRRVISNAGSILPDVAGV